MKTKKTIALFLTCLSLVVMTWPGLAQTEKGILENMIKAMGGRETLAGIRDTRMSGNIEIIHYGMTAPMTIFQKEPNKYRMEMEIMGMSMVQVYDGQKAMMTNPQTGEVIELPPDQAQQMKKQALGNDAILNPEKYGITYAYKGKEEIDGKPCHVLEQKFPEGDIVTLYLDGNSYLPYKSRSKAISPTGGEIESETVFGDYRKVDSTTVAFSITIYQGGVEFIRMTLSEVVYNTGLDDSLFTLK
ncbi:MAG: LolA family protein [Candidatus Saccharicenans sp.]|uniref:LolA family protein n=1 Tax=Candidatus Saccharicenans sp. TaxID=2819258 RepID=UPI004049422F